MKQVTDFFVYVKGFYSSGEIDGSIFGNALTDLEISLAIGMYLERLRHVSDLTWGGGDSVDRERVRMIALELRKLSKH